MAKIVSRKKQNDVYKRLVRIIQVLSKDESAEATDAICDAFDIALVVGDIEMLEALGERPRTLFGSKGYRIGNKLSNLVEFIDDCMWK